MESEKIEGMVFTCQKFNLYCLESGFVFNNLFLQDTLMFDTHKRRQFLKEIFVRRKICSASGN